MLLVNSVLLLLELHANADLSFLLFLLFYFFFFFLDLHADLLLLPA